MFFVHGRENPLYSLSDVRPHWYSKDQLLSDLTGKRVWLNGVLAKDLTTALRNFSTGVLTKHILKNIRGDSAFSKTCSNRTATSLKRNFDTVVFL